MNMRLHEEEKEKKELAVYACFSENATRKVDEPPCPVRTAFMRDVGRIVHCKAFRRLRGKTQVVAATVDDHFRNRLTHTLEVALLGRTLSRALRVNEDLTEAICLAHDLGHTPFGHAGEYAMDALLKEHGRHFEHNRQSRRVVEVLEKRMPSSPGLNLTTPVLEGLSSHCTSYDTPEKGAGVGRLEAQLADIADECAYTAHDMEDALRKKYVQWQEVKKLPLIQRVLEKLDEKSVPKYPQRLTAAMLGLLTYEAISHTEKKLQSTLPRSAEDIASAKERLAGFSESMRADLNQCKEYLFTHYYTTEAVKKRTEHNVSLLQKIFRSIVSGKAHIPAEFAESHPGGDLLTMATDFIAGMTDAFAEDYAKKI